MKKTKMLRVLYGRAASRRRRKGPLTLIVSLMVSATASGSWTVHWMEGPTSWLESSLESSHLASLRVNQVQSAQSQYLPLRSSEKHVGLLILSDNPNNGDIACP